MHKTTLLVIEDDAAIRRFVRCALEEQGHKVHEADTLARGLIGSPARAKPDNADSDLGLPDGDGVGFAARFAQLEPTSVLVLSARWTKPTRSTRWTPAPTTI